MTIYLFLLAFNPSFLKVAYLPLSNNSRVDTLKLDGQIKKLLLDVNYPLLIQEGK